MSEIRQYADLSSPIAFSYPADWILVIYPPLQQGGAFFDIHNSISALESLPKEETGLVTYASGDFSLRMLVYREGWQGDAAATARVEGQRLHQYHYQVSEVARIDIGPHHAAQVNFTNMSARDGAYIVCSLDKKRWLLASLSAAAGELNLHMPDAYAIIESIRLTK